MSRRFIRPIVQLDEFNSHLYSKVKTYSLVFTGYVIENGLQTVLFSTCNRSEVVSLCKQFSVTYPKIFVSEDFHANRIYKFKL